MEKQTSKHRLWHMNCIIMSLKSKFEWIGKSVELSFGSPLSTPSSKVQKIPLSITLQCFFFTYIEKLSLLYHSNEEMILGLYKMQLEPAVSIILHLQKQR